MLLELITRFITSAGVIIFAGTFLARASDSIAEQTGFGRLLVGSIFLAGATSLPEILVDVTSVRKGMPDLAVGDLMGSSLANLFIIAIADLMHRGSGKIFSRSSSAHALSGIMSINMTAIACIGIFMGERFSGLRIGPVGPTTFMIAATYLLGLRMVYVDQRLYAAHAPKPNLHNERKQKTLAKAFGGFGLCAFAIVVAAPFLADASGKIADITGLGKTFIGTTLVAFCTSLPELVSTIAAVRMGSIDLAIGNIFGSNSFNMLILVLLDLVHKSPILSTVSNSHILTGLATILATTVAVMGQLYQVEKRKKIIEPDAFAIMSIVFGALLLLYYIGTETGR